MQKIVIGFATIALLAIIAGWLTLNTKLSTAENAAGTIDMNAISTNMNTTATTTEMNAADMNAATTDMNATTMNATSVADKFPRSGLVPSRLDPKEIIFCPVLSDRSPRGECDYYNQMLANLAAGSGAVDYPKTMTRGETQTVSFVASKDQNPTEITELLGTQPAKIVALKVGRRMAVVLEGDGFTIHPPGLQERDLFLGKGTRWDWQVTAVKAQRYRLMLSAYVVVPAADGSNKESLLKDTGAAAQGDCHVGPMVRRFRNVIHGATKLEHRSGTSVDSLRNGCLCLFWGARDSSCLEKVATARQVTGQQATA